MATGFESLWKEFNIPIRNYIKKRIYNDQDVEDVLQAVFLKLLSNIKNLREESKLHAWIYRITKNTIIDFYKTNKNELNIEDYEEKLLIKDQDEINENYEMSQCIKVMIQYLPTKYKEAIILTEFQNLTQIELANRLGLTVSGAKSRVQRARAKLKDMLLNCCIIEKDHDGNIINYEIINKDCNYC